MSVDFEINNSVAILTLNNPKKLNALNTNFVEEIYDHLFDVEKKANVLVIFGTEKAFAAGVDINEIDSLTFEKALIKEFIDYKWERILNVKIPVISGVEKYALGGGFELALASDIIIANENAKFGFPEVNLGLMPGLGGTQLLTRIVGSKKASELIMSGDFIDAKEALQLNIVSKVLSSSADLKREALNLAKKIAEKSPTSLRLIKEAIQLSQNTGCLQGIKIERNLFRSLFSTSYKEKLTKKFLKK
ncbi:MAG: enoyl-CoA hydratase/isomerase family protein [Alphaproteobacteria bacterium]|nr:enoyl-CoA hydratase/isomerase family protein [Alphaproteobacteria bacterium]MBO7537027.1 enoyl-CoA hydratase/isomerase family protein [Alphaproteobacteria bacterium]